MAKNKTLKVLSTGTVAGMIAAAVLSSQAFAAVDAYSVKIGDDVLKYDKAALTESFLASKAGDAAPLYEDFTAKLAEAKGFYAFSDAKTGKFVSYNDIQAKFLEAKAAGEAFVVDNYTESATAEVIAVPTVKKVVVKDGKVVVEADGTTTPSTGVVSVSAINWSAAQSIASGQQQVVVGKIALSGTGKVSGIKLTRTGLSADTDISGVSVWDGNKRLNIPMLFSNGTADITFTNNVDLSNSSKELAIKVDFNAVAAGKQFVFSVDNKEFIKSTGTVSGTFPSVSSVFTSAGVVATGSFATFNNAPDAPVAGTQISPGTTEAQLNRIQIQAGANEDVKMTRLTLTQDGQAGDNDIKNVKLFLNGTQVGATAQLSDRKVTFTFDSGIKVTKGSSIYLDVKGDVVSGSGRTISFGMEDKIDVEAFGLTYGTAIVPANGFTGVSQNISTGSLLVSLDSTTNPAGATISADSKANQFASIKLEAVGEPIQVRKIRIANGGTGAAANIDNLKLYNGDSVIGQVVAPTFTAGIEEVAISPITVEPGKPVVIKVSADIAVGAALNDTYSLGFTGIPSDGAVGITSGRYLTAITSVMMGNTMTVGATAFNPTVVPKANTNIYRNTTNNSLVEFNLKHNLNQTVTVSQITISDTAGTGTIAASLTNAKLVDASGKTITNTIVNGNGISGDTATLRLSTPLTIKAGETVKVALVADVTGTATGTLVLNLTNATVLTSEGSTVNVTATTTAPTFTTISAGASITTVVASINQKVESETIGKAVKNVKVAGFKITNGAGAEDALVTKVYLTRTGANLTSEEFTNVRIVDADGNVLGKVDTVSTGTEVELTAPLTVKSNKSAEISVLVDFTSDVDAGDTMIMSIGNPTGTEISYKGKYTGTPGTLETGIVQGGINNSAAADATFTVGLSTMAIEKVQLSNTSPNRDAQQIEIGKFKITNNGSDAMYLKTIDLQDMAATISDVQLGTDISFKDDGGSTITLFGSTSAGANKRVYTLGTGAANNTGLRINAGASKTITVVSTNTNRVKNEVVQLKVTDFSIIGLTDATISTIGKDVLLDNITLSGSTETTAPTVSSVTSSLIDGSYTVGQIVPILVNFSEPVFVTGTPTLALSNNGRIASYASGNGTSQLIFNYTVQAGDTSADLAYAATTSLNLAGGTIKDGAANNATLTLAAPTAAGSLDNAKAIVIDTTVPTATITNATYSTAADTITLTGTNFTTAATATTDIKSLVDWTKIALTAVDDNPTTTNPTLSLADITSAVVTNDTTLTITLTGAKATSFETAIGTLGATDTITISAGFIKDAAGNVATTDALATENLDD